MDLHLQPYQSETDAAVRLIQGFWKAHNQYDQSPEEALADLRQWTNEGHKFYLLELEGAYVGFVHLGSRGGAIDWLEDIYVIPSHQNHGIGTKAIQLVENVVKTYSESMYIEAAARNERAIKLYRRLGYDCLNTVTLRRDFAPNEHEVIRTEQLYAQPFQIRRRKRS